MAQRRLPPKMTLKRSSERRLSMIYFWLALALLLIALWHFMPSQEPVDDLCPDQECEIEEVFLPEDELEEDIFMPEDEGSEEDLPTPSTDTSLVEIFQQQEATSPLPKS